MNINVNQTKVTKVTRNLTQPETKFIQPEPKFGMNINVNQTKVQLKQRSSIPRGAVTLAEQARAASASNTDNLIINL